MPDMNNSLRLLSSIVIASCSLACSKSEEKTTEPPKEEQEKAPVAEVQKIDYNAIFKPSPTEMLSESNPITEDKIALGRMLYYETRLSKNQDLSCNSCHLLDNYGVDGQPTSEGHAKQLGGRNSPTVYFAAGHFAQFWDGRAKDVEEQAKGPILNPIEMAMPDEASVLKLLRSIPGYVDAFHKAFPEEKSPISYDNLANAIGAFERKLVTKSPFDSFLSGDSSALSDAEQTGLKVFVETGCVTCHMGALLGGSQYRKLGVIHPFPDLQDTGRYEATQQENDKYLFKVPSLRNVAKTGPYLHDGSIPKLRKVIMLMGRHQLGIRLSREKVLSIETFLGSLTGEIPMTYIAKPTLPENGPNTPKPDPNISIPAPAKEHP